MKGYKGFKPGLICKDKQYQENTVFEEPEAKICEKGLHFRDLAEMVDRRKNEDSKGIPDQSLHVAN